MNGKIVAEARKRATGTATTLAAAVAWLALRFHTTTIPGSAVICLSLAHRCNLLLALLGKKGEEPEIFMRIQYTQSFVFNAAGVALCCKRHGERAHIRF